jgi:hypothetical protein
MEAIPTPALAVPYADPKFANTRAAATPIMPKKGALLGHASLLMNVYVVDIFLKLEVVKQNELETQGYVVSAYRQTISATERRRGKAKEEQTNKDGNTEAKKKERRQMSPNNQ